MNIPIRFRKQRASCIPHRDHLSRLVLVFAAACSWLTVTAADQPEQLPVVVYTTEAGPCPIIIAQDSHRELRQHARYFADYMSRITGASFAVTEFAPGTPLPQPCIALGAPWLNAPEKLGYYGFRSATLDGRLLISGYRLSGTLNGMYKFLEIDLGCTFWAQDEEDIPTLQRIVISPRDVSRAPAFPRGFCLLNREAQKIAYKLGTELDQENHFPVTHNIPKIFKKHLKSHPELLPTNANGGPSRKRVHANYLAPSAAQIFAAELEEMFISKGKNLDFYIYNIEQGDDWGGYDKSPKSLELYEREAWTNPDGDTVSGLSAGYMTMMNEVATMLDKKYPGIQVGTLAYLTLQNPPGKLTAAPNLHIRFPHHRKTATMAVDETEGNRTWRYALDRWLEIAPGRVHIWDYGINFKNYLYPFPTLRPIARNLKLYAKKGIANVLVQGNYNTTGGYLHVLQNYVWSQIAWNPDLEIEPLIEYACNAYYGPAGPLVYEFTVRLANYTRGKDWDETKQEYVQGPNARSLDEMTDPRGKLLTTEILGQLQALADRARTAAAASDNPDYERRVMELRACVLAAKYWRKKSKPDDLIEKDGQLIRKEFGEPTIQIIRDEINPYLRGAAATEWGVGITQQIGQLAAHGGEIYTLEASDNSLKVAPLQSGRIGPLMAGDTEVFQTTYVFNHIGKMAGTDSKRLSDSQVEMNGPAGLSQWGGSPVHNLHQIIRTNKRGQFRITQDVHLLRKDRKYKNRTKPIIETIYSVKPDLSDFSIMFYDPTTDEWQPFDLKPLLTKPVPVEAYHAWPKLEAWGKGGPIRIVRPSLMLIDKYDLADNTIQRFDPDKPTEYELSVINLCELSFHKDLGQLKVRVICGLVNLVEGGTTTVLNRTLTIKRR